MHALRARPSAVLLTLLTAATLAMYVWNRPPPIVHASASVAPPVVAKPPAQPNAKPVELAITTYHEEVSATHLYWTQASYSDDGTVAHLMRAPIAGGTPELVAADASYGFVLAGDWLYYTASPEPELRRVSLDGATNELVTDAASTQYAMAVGGGYVYWASAGGVMRALIDGGPGFHLHAGHAQDPIAADGDYLYIGGKQLQRIAHGTTEVTTLAALGEQPSELVVIGNDVVVAVGSRLVKVPRDGGTPRTLATGGVAHRLAQADGAVYWTTWGDAQARANDCDGFELGTVRRIDPAHGTVEHVASGCEVRGFAVGPGTAFVVEGSRVSQLVGWPTRRRTAAQR